MESPSTRILRKCLSAAPGTAAFVLFLGLSAPLWSPITFNQFQIVQAEARYGVASRGALVQYLRSSFGLACNAIRSHPDLTKDDIEHPEKVFAYVFSWLPGEAITYPTEGFYYFTFDIDKRRMTGNLRLAELEKGEISLAYFYADANEHTWHRIMSQADGLQVVALSSTQHKLSYHGRTVVCTWPEEWKSQPRRAHLLAEEECLGQIRDESAMRFYLIYNRNTRSFYDILNEDDGVADSLLSIGDGHLIGQRTGFIFMSDAEYDRKVLVGVSLDSVRRNDFFDGPGDQVPFQLNLRDKLAVAYPQTMLGPGVDEHGVFLDQPEWVRLAISPFRRYASVSEVLEHSKCSLPRDSPGAYWTRLTKEWWNTDAWRQGIIEKLKREGKTVRG